MSLFLSEAERDDIVVEWNQTGLEYARDLRVHMLFEREVDAAPDAVAVAFEGAHVSYAELDRQANRIAHVLRRENVGLESTVVIHLAHSPAMIAAILGVLKAGAAYVPVDAHQQVDRLDYVLDQPTVRAVVTEQSLVPAFAGRRVPVLCVDGDDFNGAPDSRPKITGVSTAAACVIYTSGSTGAPKAVVITHGNLTAMFHAWKKAYALRSRARSHCQIANFSFVVFQADWVRALCSGAKLVLSSPDTVLTPRALLQCMFDEGVDFAEFVPGVLRNLLHFLEETGQSLALRSIVVGSDRWYLHEHIELERFCGPDTRRIHSFGLTETTVDSAYFESTGEPLAAGQLTPIGRPFPNVRLYILDDDLEPVPPGMTGELFIGGHGLARGYAASPAETAVRFVPNPFATSDAEYEDIRLYRTGDSARYLSDGNVQFLGRADQQIKVRGFRVETGEIERVFRSSAAVKDVVVVARDRAAGEVELVAYVVPAGGIVKDLEPGPIVPLPDGSEVVSLSYAETDQVYREIFEGELYTRHGVSISAGDIVFDIGANVGMFTLYAVSEAPGVAVYAFEPAPPAFEALALNIARRDVNAKAFNVGIGADEGKASFTFYPHSSGMSSFYGDVDDEEALLRVLMANELARGAAAAEGLTGNVEAWLDLRLTRELQVLPITTISAVLSEEGIERVDLLKIVVQKAEWEVLQGIDDADWPRIRQLVLEVYDIDGRIGAIERLLRERGYTVTVDQAPLFAGSSVHLVYATRPADEREVRRTAVTVKAQPFSVSDIQTHARASLPDYMIPARIVVVPSLPLTATGKVDRSALPDPKVADPAAEPDFVAPRTPTELAVAAIWSELLDREVVGVRSDFFRLGGHSLLGTQLIARIRREFGVEVPLRTFLRSRTIETLAEEIERLRAAGTIESVPSIVPIARERYRRRPASSPTIEPADVEER